MSIPQPKIELEGHCSAIYDNTLYVLSPNGFQSLPLTKHAQWSKETSGVPVTGPACVTVAPGGDESQAALWVIGGTTDNHDFMGVQIYSFAQKSWQTITMEALVMQGRTNHSAVYLQDSQSILVYAGSQPNAPSWLSSQTFVLSTQSPYTIQAFVSQAPPTNLPILVPWNTSDAVMLGGSPLNTQIFTFNPSAGWQELGTSLTSALDASSRGIIIDGDDGSKVVELYDFSTSPNNVTQIVLLDAGGVTAPTGQTIASLNPPTRRKRGLTLNNWPTYNNKYAPTVTRADCSVAQGSNGVAVVAGGSSAVPVALFNQDRNSWIDASQFFDSKDQQPLKPTSSLSHKPTATPTKSSAPSATTTSASAGGAAHERMLRTLGITLGVLCGIAVTFVLVLIYLRWRKLQRRKKEGYLDEKENEGARMSFADRGVSFMKEAGGSVNEIASPSPQSKPWNNSNNGSHSSLAIIAGKFSNKRVSNVVHAQKDSYDSTSRLFKGEDPVELVDIEKTDLERRMAPRVEQMPGAAQYGPTLTEDDAARGSKERRKRSSGWSRYFATSTPTGPNGLSHLPSAYANKKIPPSDASPYSNERGISEHARMPSSEMLPALDLELGKTFDGQRLSHVAMHSPSFNDSREDLARRGSGPTVQPQKGLIVDPGRRRSQTDSISSYNRSTMSSARTSEFYNESIAEPWTPTNASFKDHLINRPPSDAFFDQRERLPSRGKSAGFFPGPGTSYRPPRSPKVQMTHEAAPTSDWAAPKLPKEAKAKAVPGPIAGPGHILAQQARPAQDRDSSVTVFPRGVPSAYYSDRDRRKEQRDPAQPLKPVNSDLAWLNLGLSGPPQTRL